MDTISVLALTYQRPNALERFLTSLLAAEHFSTIEVLILLNGNDEISEKILAQYAIRYSNITYMSSPRKMRGAARNELIQKAQGTILYFVDDDVLLAPDVFSVIINTFTAYPYVDIIGGPNLTPPGSSVFQKAQGAVLGSFFGTLWMSQRYRAGKRIAPASDHKLILCNLALRACVFNAGLVKFHNQMVCAEENELLITLQNNGHKALFVPSLVVYHERRNTIVEYCVQMFTYGRGRGQLPHLCSPLFAIPSLFVLYMGILIFFRFNELYWYFPLGIYVICASIASVYIFMREVNIFLMLYTLLLFPLTHISYGCGYVIGKLGRRRRMQKAFLKN